MMSELLLTKEITGLKYVCALVLILFCSYAYAQVEPLDTLKQIAPAIDTTLTEADYGIVTPTTTVVIDTNRIQTQDVGHSPKKAALFSAILPGLGQAYNGAYWKIPVIYGGFLALGYGVAIQNDRLSVFRQARLAEDIGAENENPLIGTRAENYSIDKGLESTNRNRDYMIIIMAGFYALNIVDAIVDAHLREFEVNEDLSFQLKPTIGQTALATAGKYHVGLSLTLNLK